MWASAPRGQVLLVEGWDDDAEGSGGHWLSITHNGAVRCLLQGDRPLALPRDVVAAAGAVLASIPRVYAVWYVVTPAPPPSPSNPAPPRGPGLAPRGVGATAQPAARHPSSPGLGCPMRHTAPGGPGCRDP